MSTFLATFIVIGIAFASLAIGLIIRNKPIAKLAKAIPITINVAKKVLIVQDHTIY